MGTYGPKPTTAPAGAIILHPGDNISAIVNAAPIGATFYFEPGIYRGVSLTPKNGQTFIGAEGAILNGSAVLTGFTQQGNLWVIGGQTQEGVRHATGEGDGVSMRAGYPETVFINDTPLKPVDALSKVVAGTFYFDYAADKIYIADNPTGQKVEAGKLANAFGGNAQNVTVQNLVIEKYDPPVQGGAIQGNKGWIIQDNEVRLNYAVGIIGREDSKIVGNYVHDNGQMGLGGSGDNILVEGNEIAKNGFWSGIDVLWEGGGFKFANTDGLIVRGNYSHDNHGSGMWTDIDNINTLYENNVVAHNTHIGITHEISYDAVIRNNTLIGNGYGDPRGWLWGAEIQIQNSRNVEVYGNRIDMTGGGNGVVLIQQNRGSGEYGPYVTTGNNIHDNVIVDHDNTGKIGGVADYNWSGVANGGNVWVNNQYYMPDVGNRFWWGGTYNFAQFKTSTHESGSISQSYPNTDDWLDGTPADTSPPPADTDPPPPVDTDPPPPVDTDPPPPADTEPPPPADTDPPPPADTDPPPPADTDPPPPTDTDPPPPVDTNPPPQNLVLRGGRGSDHLTGGDGNDQLYGARGYDVLMGQAGDDVLRGDSGRDILMGGAGNDTVNGGVDRDYLLLDGSMQDYSFAISKRGTTITNSAGEVDTVKNVEVVHFSDGTNYLVGKTALVQTTNPNINTFLADSGVDQSLIGPVPVTEATQAPVQSTNLASTGPTTGTTGADPGNPTPASIEPGAGATANAGSAPLNNAPQQSEGPGAWLGGEDVFANIFGQHHTGQAQGVEKLLSNAALWNAVDATSNTPTDADKVMADLKQQLDDSFEHSVTADDLSALLHLIHHD